MSRNLNYTGRIHGVQKETSKAPEKTKKKIKAGSKKTRSISHGFDIKLDRNPCFDHEGFARY